MLSKTFLRIPSVMSAAVAIVIWKSLASLTLKIPIFREPILGTMYLSTWSLYFSSVVGSTGGRPFRPTFSQTSNQLFATTDTVAAPLRPSSRLSPSSFRSSSRRELAFFFVENCSRVRFGFPSTMTRGSSYSSIQALRVSPAAVVQVLS